MWIKKKAFIEQLKDNKQLNQAYNLLDDLKETKARVEKNKIENANLLAEINKLKRENTELTNRLQDIKNYIK